MLGIAGHCVRHLVEVSQDELWKSDRFRNDIIAKKRGILYSEAVSFVRTRLRFSILRTVLMAVRGFRGKEMREDDPNSDINLIETPYGS